jgi:hypothetical protein
MAKEASAYNLAYLSKGDRLVLNPMPETEQPEETVTFLDYASDEGRVDVLTVEDADGFVLEVTPDQVKEIL